MVEGEAVDAVGSTFSFALFNPLNMPVEGCGAVFCLVLERFAIGPEADAGGVLVPEGLLSAGFAPPNGAPPELEVKLPKRGADLGASAGGWVDAWVAACSPKRPPVDDLEPAKPRPPPNEIPRVLSAGGGPAGVVDGLFPKAKPDLVAAGVVEPAGAELFVVGFRFVKRPAPLVEAVPPPKRLVVWVRAVLAGAVVLLGVENPLFVLEAWPEPASCFAPKLKPAELAPGVLAPPKRA